MKVGKIIIGGFAGFFLLIMLIFFIVIAGDEEMPESQTEILGQNLSPEVLAYQPLVSQYAAEYGISDYVQYLLAIMMVETGGKGNDVMQCSESLGLPKDSLMPEESIRRGCEYFAGLLKKSLETGCDVNTAVQAYNYGGGYIDFVVNNGYIHTSELAESYGLFRSGGKKVEYTNPIAVMTNGGWRYDYGNMFYVTLVKQYLYVTEFNDETVNQIFQEALKYQGWKYVWGGSTPDTSFDCSGLTSWCFKSVGISLPRTAQEQYDFTQHIAYDSAEPGDLIFFTETTSSGNFVTHVGIYAGDNKMYHAGDPIGYADLTTDYWQSHLVCAGRVAR